MRLPLTIGLTLCIAILLGGWQLDRALAFDWPPAAPAPRAAQMDIGQPYSAHSHSRRAGCPAEDDPGWNWVRCGNGRRGVVTMWGTPKVVTCGELRWLVKHGDLDPHTPWLRGDWSCGRRR